MGERTWGMCQVVLLGRPERLSEQQWIDIWHGSHTRIAIETQSTFAYRQNVIARPMTPDAQPFDAIIEECFPPEAMSSQHVFYAAVGDDEKLQAHQRSMIDSCMRFIDFERIEVLPCSEYVLRYID